MHIKSKGQANSMEGNQAWKLFLAGAISGGIAAGSTLYCYRYWSKWWKDSLQQDRGAPRQPKLISMSQALDDDILGEQFTRNRQFFGRTGQEQVLNAFVVVVGLGVSLPTCLGSANTLKGKLIPGESQLGCQHCRASGVMRHTCY